MKRTVSICLCLGILSAAMAAGAESPSVLRKQLFEAVLRHDDGAIAKLRAETVAALGAQAGIPESGLRKNEPIDTSLPDLALVQARWTNGLQTLRGHYPWQALSGDKRPRSRAVGRWVRALCLARAADVGDAHEALQQGADYLLSIQGGNGVFGYAVPAAGDHGKLAESARHLIGEMEKRGVKAVENGYIVQDRGTGDLNFDNGEAAMALLAAYSSTGHAAWLEAAKRAAEWGVRQPLVPNWNYNCFHGWLAARLYRITQEQRYLDAAFALIRYGSLAGQMDDGNWFDAHNASTQYRAVMIRACLELHLALKGTAHPYAAELEMRTRLAVDSLARHTLEWGGDAAKAWEALPVDAFSLALMTFGSAPLWERALNVEVNGVLALRNHPLPESMATYLLYRAGRQEPIVPANGTARHA